MIGCCKLYNKRSLYFSTAAVRIPIPNYLRYCLYIMYEQEPPNKMLQYYLYHSSEPGIIINKEGIKQIFAWTEKVISMKNYLE